MYIHINTLRESERERERDRERERERARERGRAGMSLVLGVFGSILIYEAR